MKLGDANDVLLEYPEDILTERHVHHLSRYIGVIALFFYCSLTALISMHWSI